MFLTLGILWSVSGKQVQFASSADGGRTFRPAQLVAKQESGAPSVTDAVPWNEWGLAQFLASQAGNSQDSFVDQSHLGLSVRMERPQGITEIGLTADARNTFHAFWASVDDEGNHELLTRIIEASSNVPATSVRLTSGEDLPCASKPELLNPDMPGKPPALTFEGQREVTSLLDLQVDQLNYAAESHTVTVQVILRNKSASLVRGPLTLFAVGLHSDFGRPIVLNATGTKQAQPFWDLSEAIPAEGLRSLAHSRPVELRFKLEQFDEARPSSDALASWVRVYSRGRRCGARGHKLCTAAGHTGLTPSRMMRHPGIERVNWLRTCWGSRECDLRPNQRFVSSVTQRRNGLPL